MYRKRIILAAVLAAATCCQRMPEPSRYGQYVVPQEYESFESTSLNSEITEVQPMTGLVLWSDNSKCSTWPIQLEFAYLPYNGISTGKGVFDWSMAETVLDDIASRGHQAVVRFRYTCPGRPTAVPDWIKALPDYTETKGESEGLPTDFPDWRCSELQEFHMEFHRKFAERYDSDPRLAFVQTGFGLWAEYHIYDGPFIPGRTFPSKEFQSSFFSAMEEWFRECTWSISIDAADKAYSPFSAQPELKNLRFGIFDDSFMCKGHDGYNRDCWSFFGRDRYMDAPAGGEFSYGSAYDQKHCLDAKGLHGRVFEDEAAKYHLTYILANDQPEYQKPSRFKEASMCTGYRFAIADLRIKDNTAAICIFNTGTAPIYRDAYVSVNGVRSGWSLRQLMPGNYRWIEITGESIQPGSCAVAIECDHLVPGQHIQFEAAF